MQIVVLSLTRDRLEYSRHCFGTLRECAGIDFDHLVLDQGSSDGTAEWLGDEVREGRIDEVIALPSNIGIARGMNRLLDLAGPKYDAYVKVDNDCEFLHPRTLVDVCALALETNAILSPRVQGLHWHPPTINELEYAGELIDETTMVGGIFTAMPGSFAAEWRHDECQPVWGGPDDALTCVAFKENGGAFVGYVRRLAVNHFETTDGQHERYPGYFERRVLEGGPP